MVNTRSQTAKNSSTETYVVDTYSDTESGSSIPEVLSRRQMTEFDDGDLINSQKNAERNDVNQRFSEMNKQISELS